MLFHNAIDKNTGQMLRQQRMAIKKCNWLLPLFEKSLGADA
jgi:hypothetical protein